jgi:Domain of unknown function (DUF4190)
MTDPYQPQQPYDPNKPQQPYSDPYGTPQPGSPAAPYGSQPGSPGPSYGNQPGSPATPYSGQPYTGQPYSGQEYGGQPYGGQYSTPQYGAQGYGAAQYPTSGYGAPQSSSTNVMAILSLVFAFVFAPVGIVLGHIAKKQIKERGEQGSGLATAGLVLSYIFTGLTLAFCCIGVIAAIATDGSNSTY